MRVRDDDHDEERVQNLPLGREESAEVELLPPKMEDIAVLFPFFFFCFLYSFLQTKERKSMALLRSVRVIYDAALR